MINTHQHSDVLKEKLCYSRRLENIFYRDGKRCCIIQQRKFLLNIISNHFIYLYFLWGQVIECNHATIVHCFKWQLHIAEIIIIIIILPHIMHVEKLHQCYRCVTGFMLVIVLNQYGELQQLTCLCCPKQVHYN